MKILLEVRSCFRRRLYKGRSCIVDSMFGRARRHHLWQIHIGSSESWIVSLTGVPGSSVADSIQGSHTRHDSTFGGYERGARNGWGCNTIIFYHVSIVGAAICLQFSVCPSGWPQDIGLQACRWWFCCWSCKPKSPKNLPTSTVYRYISWFFIHFLGDDPLIPHASRRTLWLTPLKSNGSSISKSGQFQAPGLIASRCCWTWTAAFLNNDPSPDIRDCSLQGLRELHEHSPKVAEKLHEPLGREGSEKSGFALRLGGHLSEVFKVGSNWQGWLMRGAAKTW